MFTRLLAIFLILSFSALSPLAGCGGDDTKSLNNPPEGFEFTDENGNAITSADPGDTIQIRSEDGEIILSFEMPDGNINFTDVLIGRTDTVAFAHFESEGVVQGTVTLFLPCLETTNTVYVTPGAQSATEVSTDGEGEGIIELTIEEPTASGYTFANAVTRAGTEDCRVSADAAVFSTGATGATVEGGGTPPNESVIAFSKAVLEESGKNNGAFDDEVIVTVFKDSFTVTSGALTQDTHYTLSGTSIPDGLTTMVTATSSTTLKITLSGKASSHSNNDDVAGITIGFLAAAFDSGQVPADGASEDLAIDFDDPTIILFSAGTFDGDLREEVPLEQDLEKIIVSGRSGAQEKCISQAEKVGFSEEKTIVPFISFSPVLTRALAPAAPDSIKDFTSLSYSYLVPDDQKIVSLSKTQIASTWNGLLDESIDASLQSAEVMTNETQTWWSGSDSKGVGTSSTCSDWTYNGAILSPTDVKIGVVIEGDYGDTTSTNATWITQDTTKGKCGDERHLLCIAYERQIVILK